MPTSADSAYWNTWQFDDGNGNIGRTFVQRSNAVNYVVLDSTYAGLKGFVSTYTVASHAEDTASPQDVTAGVLQQLQLASIPIYQFAMYSSGKWKSVAASLSTLPDGCIPTGNSTSNRTTP